MVLARSIAEKVLNDPIMFLKGKAEREAETPISMSPGDYSTLTVFVERNMDLNRMMNRIREMPGYPKVGMIASHMGVVREDSLNGTATRGMEVSFSRDIISKIVKDTKMLNGIIEVLVEVNEGELDVGDEVMAVDVAGDTREHVFPALIEAVDRLKMGATKKRKIFS